MNPLWNDEQETPLQHLRVLDLSIMLPGPYLTRILAQYGAEVIKVEALPHGDTTRELKQTAMGEWLNQGKRSVAINLKTTQGVELVRQMMKEVDVVVENFREGVMDELGLGYADVSGLNPDLLYCSLRGFQGKDSMKAGHDLNFVATSGCGEWLLADGPNYATHWGDLVGGTLVPALKLLAHLTNPDRRGMHLVSYMDEGFRTLFLHRAFDAIRGEDTDEPQQFGSHQTFNGSQPHSRYYRCQDGAWVSVNAVQPKHWDLFCETIGQPGWRSRREDPSLIPELTRLFEQQTATYWDSLMSAHNCCVFRVVSWVDHLAQTNARSQLQKDPLTWAGFLPNSELTAAPALGQDTYTVLHAMGLTNKEFTEYVAQGILFQPTPPDVKLSTIG